MGIVEHDDNLILGDVDVCVGVSGAVKRGQRRKPRCCAERRESDSPLSIPSAPSLIAASKLASVFSGYAAEACARVSLSPISTTRTRRPGTHSTMSPALRNTFDAVRLHHWRSSSRNWKSRYGSRGHSGASTERGDERSGEESRLA